MNFAEKLTRKVGELIFNGLIAKLPNRGFQQLRVRYLRMLGARIGTNVRISRNLKVLGAQSLVIEDDVSIANSVLLDARAGLDIREGALIGFQSIVLTHTHAWPDPSKPIQKQGTTSRPVTIGSLSWLGMRVMILPGASVGTSSVIGAGSVVTKVIPDMVVASGNPCTVISERRDRTGT